MIRQLLTRLRTSKPFNGSRCASHPRHTSTVLRVSEGANGEKRDTSLPSNLTIIGLPFEISKSDRAPRGGVSESKERKTKCLHKGAGHLTRRDKKKLFFSGSGLVAADRLTKSGKPLLKNLLRDGISTGDLGSAVMLCEERLRSGEKVDDKLVTTMIRTFGSAGELDKAIDRKFVATVLSFYLSLIFGLVFRKIGKDPRIKVRLDNYHCAAVVHACSVNGEWWKAVELFELCKKDGRVTPNAVVYGAVLNACMKGKRFDKVLKYFEEIKERHIKMDTSCYNIVIRAAAHAGDHVRATEMFFEVTMSDRIRPDIVTYLAILNSCAVSGDYLQALALLESLKRVSWLKPNVKVYTSVMSSCINAGQPVKALEVLREACHASSITLRTAESDSNGDISSDLLFWKFPGTRHSGAKHHGLGDAPDSLLLGLGIVACSLRPSLSGLALQLLDQIIANNMKPTYTQISNVIRSLHEDGKTTECVRVYRMAYRRRYIEENWPEEIIFEDRRKLNQFHSSEGLSRETSSSTVKINICRVYEPHMIKTRLQILFHSILSYARDRGSPNIKLLIFVGMFLSYLMSLCVGYCECLLCNCAVYY